MMKKCQKFMILLCVLTDLAFAQAQIYQQNQNLSQFYQGKLTVTELKTEREVAERLENLLYPFIGKTTILVDLQLEYPPLKIFGSALDRTQSLPGLPMSRSTGVLPDKVGDETLLPTHVTKKRVTVILNKGVSKNDEQFARELIQKWLSFDSKNGDELTFIRNQKKLLEHSAPGSAISGANLMIILLVIGAIAIFLFVLISSRITNGFKYLIRSIELMNKQSSNVLSNIFGAKPQTSKSQSDAMSNLQISPKKPLPITIIENKNGNDEENELDFSFVEEISPEQFSRLIQNEPPEVVALLLQKLPPKYSAEFLDKFPHLSMPVIKQILDPNTEHMPSLPGLLEKLKKRIKMIKNENLYKVDAEKLLTNIINESPPASAANLMQIIGNIDPAKQSLIRKKVFLLEDIVKLDDNIIEGFIRGINHDQLVKFLCSVDDRIREKFFRNMTPRAVSIIKEDIEIMGELTPGEREEATRDMLNLFRSVLTLA